MDSAIYGFGFIHFLLYAGLGLSYIVYHTFRNITGIVKTIWKHRDDALPRYEA